MAANGTGRLVVTIVWDGLRPDFVTPEVTPVLHGLASAGSWCSASRCAYPSETRVNAAALATGCYPGRTGITGNSIFVRGFDVERPARVANTGDHTHLARIHEIDAPLVHAPWVADEIASAGGVMVVASSGSPGAAFLQDPRAEGVTLNHALLRPESLRERVLDLLGPPPPDSMPATARSDWMTRGLLELLLPDVVRPAVLGGKPALVHWWLTDPDHTAHSLGLGAPETLQSLRENDRRLASLLETLDELGLARYTDVLLTADHGFSTAGQPTGLDRALVAAELREAPDSDDVVTTGQSGGAITLHERAYGRAAAIVRWLQQQPWMGPVFVRDGGPAGGLPGTLPLSTVWNGRVGARAPDIRFSPDWTDAANEAGGPHQRAIAGSVLAGGGRGASHGSASPYDMRNSLFAWGPRFKRDLYSPAPCGIVDVAPTVRHILGLPEVPADGRVLHELLRGGPSPEELQATQATLESTAMWPGGAYRQRVALSRVRETTYLDRAETEHS